MHTLRKKTEPKQCPLGTVLKNGALFSKKGTKVVPLWQSAPHQKGTVFQNSALRAPFSTKMLKMVPSWKKGTVFAAKKVISDALEKNGTVSATKKVKNGAVL